MHNKRGTSGASPTPSKSQQKQHQHYKNPNTSPHQVNTSRSFPQHGGQPLGTGILFKHQKILLVYRNGEPRSLEKARELPILEGYTFPQVLKSAEKILGLPFRARHLFSLRGERITDVNILNDLSEVVVGCGEPFKEFVSLQRSDSDASMEISNSAFSYQADYADAANYDEGASFDANSVDDMSSVSGRRDASSTMADVGSMAASVGAISTSSTFADIAGMTNGDGTSEVPVPIHMSKRSLSFSDRPHYSGASSSASLPLHAVSRGVSAATQTTPRVFNPQLHIASLYELNQVISYSLRAGPGDESTHTRSTHTSTVEDSLNLSVDAVPHQDSTKQQAVDDSKGPLNNDVENVAHEGMSRKSSVNSRYSTQSANVNRSTRIPTTIETGDIRNGFSPRDNVLNSARSDTSAQYRPRGSAASTPRQGSYADQDELQSEEDEDEDAQSDYSASSISDRGRRSPSSVQRYRDGGISATTTPSSSTTSTPRAPTHSLTPGGNPFSGILATPRDMPTSFAELARFSQQLAARADSITSNTAPESAYVNHYENSEAITVAPAHFLSQNNNGTAEEFRGEMDSNAPVPPPLPRSTSQKSIPPPLPPNQPINTSPPPPLPPSQHSSEDSDYEMGDTLDSVIRSQDTYDMRRGESDGDEILDQHRGLARRKLEKEDSIVRGSNSRSAEGLLGDVSL